MLRCARGATVQSAPWPVHFRSSPASLPPPPPSSSASASPSASSASRGRFRINRAPPSPTPDPHPTPTQAATTQPGAATPARKTVSRLWTPRKNKRLFSKNIDRAANWPPRFSARARVLFRHLGRREEESTPPPLPPPLAPPPPSHRAVRLVGEGRGGETTVDNNVDLVDDACKVGDGPPSTCSAVAVCRVLVDALVVGDVAFTSPTSRTAKRVGPSDRNWVKRDNSSSTKQKKREDVNVEN